MTRSSGSFGGAMAGAMLALLLGLLAAIAAPSPAPAQAPPGVLIAAQIAEPKSLDPQVVTALNDFRILVNIYDGLVRYRPGSLEIAPALAEAWTISDDGLTYTFTLRENVRFHDGTPVDAAAVVFTFERMLDPDHPHADTGPFPLAFFFDKLAAVDALDPRTVRFTLSEPFAPFLSNLAYPTALIVSPAAVRARGRDFGRHPVGSGPFRFADWQPNRRVMLEADPDYWDGPPGLDKVVFRPVTDTATRVAEMLSGGVDLMVEVPPDAVATFAADPDYRLYQAAGPHLWFLILNLREGPLADPRVRRAVNLAIDRQALVRDVLQGTAEVATGAVPAAFAWAHDPDLPPWPHDPAAARRLLEEAGAVGAELTFYVTRGGSGMLSPVAMAAAIQADLAAIGLQVRIESFEWNAYLARVNAGLAGQADMAEMAWMTNDPDTLPFLALRSDAVPDQGGFNSGYYDSAEADRLIAAARRTADREERAALYRQLQRQLRKDMPWAPVASWKQNAVTTDRVEGFALEPSFLLRLKDVVKR
ncbi:ABC transporter substrate-binding protein [Marinibaculum pumilum]|uniref:ABC transporter substrate-binding protein n=1 Tax=Marinibaculum pumilum TaxID=1766165 RepID=A0ABV7L1B8_9PROT